VIAFLAVILAGFFLGLRHASEPDHVVAVTTILTREREPRRAALLGLYWGLGHTLTIFLVGAAILLLKLSIPERIGTGMELSVAVMLVVLGALTLRDYFRGRATKPMVDLDRRFGRLSLYGQVRPFVVGVIHGLAGSAALILFVVGIIPDVRWALLYLLVFGAGTITGMLVVTLGLAAATQAAASRIGGLHGWLRLSSGAVSIVLGLFVAWRTLTLIGVLPGEAPPAAH
jgi:high-affinity nickel-transport protein